MAIRKYTWVAMLVLTAQARNDEVRGTGSQYDREVRRVLAMTKSSMYQHNVSTLIIYAVY